MIRARIPGHEMQVWFDYSLRDFQNVWVRAMNERTFIRGHVDDRVLYVNASQIIYIEEITTEDVT